MKKAAFVLSGSLTESRAQSVDSCEYCLRLTDALKDTAECRLVLRAPQRTESSVSIRYDDGLPSRRPSENRNAFFDRYNEWIASAPLAGEHFDCAAAMDGLDPYCLAAVSGRIDADRKLAFLRECPSLWFSGRDSASVTELFGKFDVIVCSTDRARRELIRLTGERIAEKTVLLPPVSEEEAESSVTYDTLYDPGCLNLVTVTGLIPNSTAMHIPGIADALRKSGVRLRWHVLTEWDISPLFLRELALYNVFDEVVISRTFPDLTDRVKYCDGLVCFEDAVYEAEEPAARYGVPVFYREDKDLTEKLTDLANRLCGKERPLKTGISTVPAWKTVLFG